MRKGDNMADHIPAEVFPPGEFLRDELEARGWTQTEFAELIRRPTRVVNEIIAAKRGVTPETAKEIAAALGTTAQFWMNLETAYQLSKIAPAPEHIAREAKLRDRFPVWEMMKRGWVENSPNYEVVETRVLGFFGLKSFDDELRLAHAAHRTRATDGEDDPKAATLQLAWLFRVKQIAREMVTPPYSEKKLRDALANLRRLMVDPEEARNVPRMLQECGVRYVVVESLPNAKIDGACFWLDKKSPVIGMSLRFDRIDNFWFVLRHEIEHVLQKHGQESEIIDVELDGEKGSAEATNIPEEERVANFAGSDFCVPKTEMDLFIARKAPFFSERDVLGFASRLQVHPGIVAGQLRRRINRWDIFTKLLVKIRQAVTSAAIVDGWGQVPPVSA